MKTVLGLLTGLLVSLPLPVLAIEGLAWMKKDSTTVGDVEISNYYCLHYRSNNNWFKLSGITDAITVSGDKCFQFGISTTDRKDFIAPIGNPSWFNSIDYNKDYVKTTWN